MSESQTKVSRRNLKIAIITRFCMADELNGQALPVHHTKPYKKYNFQIDGTSRCFGLRLWKLVHLLSLVCSFYWCVLSNFSRAVIPWQRPVGRAYIKNTLLYLSFIISTVHSISSSACVCLLFSPSNMCQAWLCYQLNYCLFYSKVQDWTTLLLLIFVGLNFSDFRDCKKIAKLKTHEKSWHEI